MSYLQTVRINKRAAIARQRESIANWSAGMAKADTAEDRAWVQKQIDRHEAEIARIKSDPWPIWN
jgi:hypothetical protein